MHWEQEIRRPKWNFAEWFVLSQTFLPALLYLPGSQAFRVPIRVASYGISLCVLIYWLDKRKRQGHASPPHPAIPWLFAALLYLALMLFHPLTNSLLAGVAQISLYFAVFAPVFWAPIFVESHVRLKRLLWLLLVCSGISAFFGVMQVRDPDRWMPREFSSVFMESDYGLGTVMYEGADGRTIIRPPGLGDAPGAVAGPAVFALFLGVTFVLTGETKWKKMAGAILATFGAAAIFLALVRSSFLIASGMIAFYLFLLISQRRLVRAGVVLLAAGVAVIAALFHSAAVGGESVTSRFQTILEGDPMSLYYESRGSQVEHAFTELLPEHPLGAGLGRWGMMNAYFGNPANTDSPPIWVEVQWPGWIIDGGIILLVLYPVALLIAIVQQARLAFDKANERISDLACILLAANAGLLALCFSYPVFASPVGMQFWFLSGALHGLHYPSRKTTRVETANPNRISRVPHLVA